MFKSNTVNEDVLAEPVASMDASSLINVLRTSPREDVPLIYVDCAVPELSMG